MKAGGFRRLGPAFSAMILALATASGLAPALLEGSAPELVVVDDSPSCSPLPTVPPGSLVAPAPDLAGTLVLAAASAGSGRVRLYTDGCDAAGMPPVPTGTVFDVVLRPRRDNIGIGTLEIPDRIGVGEPVAVGIPVVRTAGPGEETTVEVRLWRDGSRVGPPRMTLSIGRGRMRTVRVADRVDRAGLVRYRATLHGETGPEADDVAETWVRVGEEPVVLVVGEAPPLPGCVPVGIDPGQVATWLREPGRRAGLDAILVGEAVVARDAQRALAHAVREGTGLILLDSRGLEGGPLEPLLPLTARPPEGRAILVLLDYSGSMAAHLDELRAGAERLLARFGPEDRVAAIAFRDEIVFASPWSGADAAAWPIRAHRPYGNTMLLPALRQGRRMLREVQARQRRVFVVSDGRWGELDRGGASALELVTACGQLVADGVDLAALFVGADTPPEARALFPRAIDGGQDFPEELLALEEGSPDRRVAGPVEASSSRGPAWLGTGLPEGAYRDVERLFPRGAGESVVLRSGPMPLAATLETAGRVLQIAPSLRANPGVRGVLPDLVRAVSRADNGVRIRTEWTARGLRIVGHGPEEGDFLVGGHAIPSRAAGFDRREALVARPPTAPVSVEWGGARHVSAGPAAAELAGLHARPGVAAGIAAASGGRYGDSNADASPARERRPLPAALLLPALLLVMLPGVLRRSA